MFNMERPLPVGLFQTVQAFAVNCYNLLQCSLFHSKQPTCSPTVNLVSEWVRWFINHHLKGPQNPLNAEWVQPLWVPFHLKSFFWGDMPMETRRHQSNDFQKFGSSKTSDLSLKKVSMMSSVFKPSTHHPWHQSVAYSTGWFCWSPGWIPYQRRKPQKFPNSHDLWAFRLVLFLFNDPRCQVPSSSYSSILEYETMVFVLAGFFNMNFHQPIFHQIFHQIILHAIF